MFNQLGKKFTEILGRLRGRGVLTEADVTALLREMRVTLLEADVALPVAKALVEAIRARAVGVEVLQTLTPEHTVLKIVHEELISLLSHPQTELSLRAKAPVGILLVGLQGSGKTTMSAKIAQFLSAKKGKKILMVSVDVYRPAAQHQLEILGQQMEVDTVPIVEKEMPLDIARRALGQAERGGYDVLIVDTAGRGTLDESLMEELQKLKQLLNPHEILLVADALLGQDAVRTAQVFEEKVGLTGICLSRVDGDARGGAALSIRSVTGCPLKFLGIGEKPHQIEVFEARRVADRILDKGDMVGLVEKATESLNQAETQKTMERLSKGVFTLEDLAMHLRQMEKMGGVSGMLKLLPGMQAATGAMKGGFQSEVTQKKHLALISSMTVKERRDPALLNASRKRRIAGGSGCSVPDLNRLLQGLTQMQTMMKQLQKLGGARSLMASLFSKRRP